MKKGGFTMIELIFVIVILGILAAMAIPKLSVTRDDAKVAKDVMNASQALHSLGAEWTSKEEWLEYTQEKANESVECLTFTTSNDGNVTLAPLASASAACTESMLLGVKKLAASNGLLNQDGSAKIHRYGGSKIAND